MAQSLGADGRRWATRRPPVDFADDVQQALPRLRHRRRDRRPVQRRRVHRRPGRLPARLHRAQPRGARAPSLRARRRLRPDPRRDARHLPRDAPNAPVFVFIHGGYWRAFSSKDFSCVATGLQASGITTVVLNYSLCPKVTIDEITRQCRAAVAWTLSHIGAHGGDPSRVAVGGHSAGGHLRAMCLEARWDEDYGLARDPIAAAVLVSGIYDLEPMRHSYLQPAIRLDDGIVARNSPLFAVRPCATPVLVTWGGDESAEFARQSTSLHEAWRAAGNASELLPQSGANHFTATDGFEDASSATCRWLSASSPRRAEASLASSGRSGLGRGLPVGLLRVLEVLGLLGLLVGARHLLAAGGDLAAFGSLAAFGAFGAFGALGSLTSRTALTFGALALAARAARSSLSSRRSSISACTARTAARPCRCRCGRG